MTEVIIGGKKYARMENLFDMGDERFIVFKQYLLQSFENLDKPSFLQMYARIIKNFNANNNYKIVIELENFKKSLDLGTLKYDCFSICFALLHIEVGGGELQSNTSSDFQLKKLESMRAEKETEVFSRGLVEEVVENFIKASPKHFQHYLGMLEMMKYLSKEEILNALES